MSTKNPYLSECRCGHHYLNHQTTRYGTGGRCIDCDCNSFNSIEKESMFVPDFPVGDPRYQFDVPKRIWSGFIVTEKELLLAHEPVSLIEHLMCDHFTEVHNEIAELYKKHGKSLRVDINTEMFDGGDVTTTIKYTHDEQKDYEKPSSSSTRLN